MIFLLFTISIRNMNNSRNLQLERPFGIALDFSEGIVDFSDYWFMKEFVRTLNLALVCSFVHPFICLSATIFLRIRSLLISESLQLELRNEDKMFPALFGLSTKSFET